MDIGRAGIYAKANSSSTDIFKGYLRDRNVCFKIIKIYQDSDPEGIYKVLSLYFARSPNLIVLFSEGLSRSCCVGTTVTPEYSAILWHIPSGRRVHTDWVCVTLDAPWEYFRCFKTRDGH